MAEQTKKSVMALVREVTEATAVSPTSASQYVTLQDGFDLEPAFDALENAELTGSIGAAKTIQGFEAPSASISHYIKHSGVEGQEPEYKLLLEGAFGAKSVAGTEYDTVSSSTVSTIKVGSGEGASFERGQAILIKDASGGYKIRPLLSVSGDDLTPGFQLPTGGAPGAGVNLGKAVLYKPGESHPTLSTWLFRANGGAVELIKGARVTEFSMEASAGELINGSFSLEGVGYHYNPIEITASTDTIDFTETGPTVRQATITAKMYKDPEELRSALETAMNAVASDTITVSYSDSTGKFTIASSGSVLSLLWNSGAGTAQTIGGKLGFSVLADDTGALTYTSDNAQTLASPQTASFDNANPLVAKHNEVFLGDSDDANPSSFSVQSLSFNLSNAKTDVLDISAESGKSGSVITGRTVSVDLVANFPKYEVDKFKRFRQNDQTSFCFNFGTKSGGNWEAGKSGCLYIPTGTISSFKLSDSDGLVTLEMSLTAYVASGAGECYLNFL